MTVPAGIGIVYRNSLVTPLMWPLEPMPHLPSQMHTLSSIEYWPFRMGVATGCIVLCLVSRLRRFEFISLYSFT